MAMPYGSTTAGRLKANIPPKPYPGDKTRLPLIQPLCVAFIPNEQWNEKVVWLQNYLTKAGELYGGPLIDLHLYQYQGGKPQLAQGFLPDWIKDWPWLLQ